MSLTHKNEKIKALESIKPSVLECPNRLFPIQELESFWRYAQFTLFWLPLFSRSSQNHVPGKRWLVFSSVFFKSISYATPILKPFPVTEEGTHTVGRHLGCIPRTTYRHGYPKQIPLTERHEFDSIVKYLAILTSVCVSANFVMQLFAIPFIGYWEVFTLHYILDYLLIG